MYGNIMKNIYVDSLPDCDICSRKPAPYDCQIAGRSTWANMCEDCFEIHGSSIGSKRVIQPKVEKSNTGKHVKAVACDSLEEICESGLQTVKCPLCETKKRVEADANYAYGCTCGARVLVNPNF